MNTNLNQEIFRVFSKEINSLVFGSGGVWSKSATFNIRACKKREAGGAQGAAQSTIYIEITIFSFWHFNKLTSLRASTCSAQHVNQNQGQINVGITISSRKIRLKE